MKVMVMKVEKYGFHNGMKKNTLNISLVNQSQMKSGKDSGVKKDSITDMRYEIVDDYGYFKESL